MHENIAPSANRGPVHHVAGLISYHISATERPEQHEKLEDKKDVNDLAEKTGQYSCRLITQRPEKLVDPQ